jgi:hypothetical protein
MQIYKIIKIAWFYKYSSPIKGWHVKFLENHLLLLYMDSLSAIVVEFSKWKT